MGGGKMMHRYKKKNNLKNKKLNGQMQYNTKEKMMDYAENKKSQQMNKRTVVGLKKKVSKDEELVEAEGNKIDNNSSADHEWKKVSKKKNFGHRAIPIAAISKNPSGVNDTSNAKLPEYAGKKLHIISYYHYILSGYFSDLFFFLRLYLRW